MTFLEIIGGVGSGASISGFSLKDLIAYVNGPDKNELETYFTFLEGRHVLVAPFDQEVTQAVIKSLESIKDETERCRLRLKSEMARYFLLELITTLSKQLMILYKYQDSNNDFLFYKTLQVVRVKFASVLCMLCAAHKVDLSMKQTKLAKMVLEHAYRPR
ncbi:hypothetical protein [Vibrio fluvialis]|uniref:hypothetical protein n=1 Tax=Vibrio fluvialis TaxID=676 RepID=UPI0012ADF216|nr:hypothetical protein [Vibrio fluvialis]MBY7903496.1 hypothetical protein [Vibrio fluvialis]MBY7942144.1 hypothetical protein [Vibrio fluvialis]MCG6363421.1 hypothetical protein [Vibrio fluvialis]